MTQNLNRSCPLCDSNDRTARKFFENNTVVSCDRCGFLYVADINETTASEEDVELSNARHTGVPSPERRHYYVLNLVKRRCGNNARVLEIGAGYGPLGKLLQDNGFQYIGFEPSGVRASVAKNEGVNIINEIHHPSRVDERYDAIVLDNVIEHVRDPRYIINNARKNLKKDGIIITIVPSRHDLRRLHPGWNNENFWIPEAHINFFRPDDLEQLYNLTDFKMKPFPFQVFGSSEVKDHLFSAKSIIEKFGWYPASLYTFGEMLEH